MTTQTALTISEVVKTFIEDVIVHDYAVGLSYETRINKEVTQFTSLLEELCLRGADCIQIEAQGSGDNGHTISTSAYSDEKKRNMELSEEEESTLWRFGRAAASFLFPEYELDDGGGLDIEFSFNSVGDQTTLQVKHNHWWREINIHQSGYTQLGV